MANSVASTNQDPVALEVPDAMAIVAADRLKLHEKIARLRALREAAEAERMSARTKLIRPVHS